MTSKGELTAIMEQNERNARALRELEIDLAVLDRLHPYETERKCRDGIG